MSSSIAGSLLEANGRPSPWDVWRCSYLDFSFNIANDNTSKLQLNFTERLDVSPAQSKLTARSNVCECRMNERVAGSSIQRVGNTGLCGGIGEGR